MAELIPGEFKKFLAEAEARDPEGFARARAERAEMEALRKDAERYRWLRNNERADVRIVGVGKRSGADLDSTVDACVLGAS